RHHLRASSLASRKNSPLTPEFERCEQFLDKLEHSTNTVLGFVSETQPAVSLTERDRQAWSALSDELAAAGTRFGASAPLRLAQFRKLGAEVAAISTVDRLTAAAAAPGLARVRIVRPQSLGYRDYKWIFAPGFTDGEFPARTSTNPLLSDTLIEEMNAHIRP